MKTIYNLLILAAITLSGCYNDDKLWEALNDQERRIQALEDWQKTANSNIEALRVLISGHDYITGLTPLTVGGETTGYTITFLRHDPVTIHNGRRGEQGADGAPGSTPAISVTQRGDGNWYWTLNGELLTDAHNNPIRANALNGSDGADAILPGLRSGAQLIAAGIPPSAANLTAWTPGAVYLSVDNGTTWTHLTGEDGIDGRDTPPLFTDVDTSNPSYITFTLAGGTTFRVYCYTYTGVLHRPEKARTPAAPFRTACLCLNNPLNKNA